MTSIRDSELPNLIHKGKVRDTHELGDGMLLMVATDRISAFDVVLKNVIPEKGAVLSQMSEFWFAQTSHIIPNHFIDSALNWNEQILPREIARRAMVVNKAERIDVECIVRGYITGSAWSEYQNSGTVSGQVMPTGMQEGDMFPEPLFTPTTKAEVGHDENMSYSDVVDMVGRQTAGLLEDFSKSVYIFARNVALKKGIIITDTKMEFGFIEGQLSLIDELLTPDSSRFWDAIGYSPGKSLPNFDKQFVRDWLSHQGWNKEPPAPELPDDVVCRTSERYFEAYKKLTGRDVL